MRLSTKALTVHLFLLFGILLSGTVAQASLFPPTVNITASPSTISQGQSATLSWTSTSAEIATIDNGIGDVPVNGSLTVSPLATTTYTITVRGGFFNMFIFIDRVTVTVVPNNYPTVDSASISTLEDTPVPVTLTGADLDSDPLTYQVTSVPNHGVLSGTAPNLIYNPAANFNGIDSFTFIANDGFVDSTSGTITLDIQAVNDAPVAQAVLTQTAFCTDAVLLDGSASTDVDSDLLSYQWSIVSRPAGSTAAFIDPTVAQPTFTADQCGTYVAQLIVNDSLVASNPATVTILAEPRPVATPDLIGMSLPEAENALTASGLIVGNVGYAYTDTIPVNLVISQSPLAATIVDEGSAVNLTISLGQAVAGPPTVTLTASPDAIALGESTTLSWSTINATSVSIDNGMGLVPTNGSMLLSPEHTTAYTITASGPDGVANAKVTVMVSAPTEPQPAGAYGTQYEDLIPADSTLAEYTPERFALVTGLITDLNNAPVADVSVTMHSHPEYGTVFTDAEGRYTMPVQGGGTMTVVFQKDGFITSHRKVYVPWNDIAITKTLQLLQEDDKSTTVTFDGSPNTIITHTSTVIVDEFGSRSTTMIFTGDNRAYVVDEEGNDVQALSTITTRATEYVTPESMPAVLPPTSAFTYCSELKVDGVERVRFAKPVTTYVDNFLGFAVGEVVPVGYYDRDRGVWVPSDNGVVVQLLDINSDGIVDALDADGDGQPDDINSNGSYADEVIGLNDPLRYTPGATFWRVAISHFTPWDCNWPYGPPSDATPPNPNGIPSVDAAATGDPDPCEPVNSYVKKRGRIFHEDIPIPGTDMTLHYASDRVAGYKQRITVPASGDSVPTSLEKIIVQINIGGRTFSYIMEPLANQKASLVWDGLDHLDRRIRGSISAEVAIGFVYQAVYNSAGNFNQAFAQAGSDVTGVRGRQEVTSWRRYKLYIETGTETLAEGWTLSHQHYLNTQSSSLKKGDGSQVKADTYIITTLENSFPPDEIATLQGPNRVIVDPAGNLFVVDRQNNRILKRSKDGIISLVAGNGFNYCEPGSECGDNGPAIDAVLNMPYDVAFDQAGNLFISDYYNSRIRKVDPDGIITTVAGNGLRGFSGDNGPATEAAISRPCGLAIDQGGNIYFADSDNDRIRKVDPDGIITTVAGNGLRGFSGDDGPAHEASFSSPMDVEVDSVGNLIICDLQNLRIRKVDSEGIITTVAGNGERGFNGDNILATEASIHAPFDVTVDQVDNLFIADTYNQRIRKVDSFGFITTVAGNGIAGSIVDGEAARDSNLYYPAGVVRDQVGDIYIVESAGNHLLKVKQASSYSSHLETFGDIYIAEGNNLVYLMSATGEHKKTLDQDTGLVLRDLNYDDENRLNTITNQFGNITTIERLADGTPTAIISADGLRTVLHIDTNNHLRQVVYPDNSVYDFTYTTDGLMTHEIEPNGNFFQHVFNGDGRITDVLDQEGGHWQYFRQSLDNGDIQIDSFTGEGNNTTNLEHTYSTGAFSFTTIDPSEDQSLFNRSADGLSEERTLPTGMISITNYGLDPEFKFKFAKEVTSTTPAGLSMLSSLGKTYEDINGDEIPDIISQTFTVNGKASVLTHNVLESKRTVTSPLGRIATELYDPATLLTSSRAVSGLFDSTYAYDSKGRLTVISTGNRRASFVHNAQGFLESSTDPLFRTTSYTYDPVGRVTSTTRPDNSTVYFTYDANGNMTVLTNPTPVDHDFTYNAVNKQSGYQTPLSGNYSYVYDRDRRLTQTNFPSGYVINNIYDSDRLSQIQTPEGNIDYTYLSSDRVATISKGGGGESLAYGYDGSLVTSETMSGTLNQGVAYTHNNDFKVASLSYGGYTDTLSYDDDGLPTDIGLFTISRNPDNGLPENVFDTNLIAYRTFNGYGEMDSQSISVGSNDLGSWSLTRNDNGRITSKTDSLDGSTSTYTYDTLGRLLTVSKDNVLVEEYRYNANGSRIFEYNSLRGINGREYTYSAEDHLVSAGSTTLAYDADGFLTEKTDTSGITRYAYSSQGELLQVTQSDATVINYVHDPLGRRIAKKVNGAMVEKYLWFGQTTLLAVYDGNDNLLMRFEYGDGRLPLAMTTGASRYYLSYDQVGTLRTVADTAGNIVKQIDYDTFGNILADSNPAFTVPFGFAGGLHDRDTGLVRFGYRDFAPEVGRWTAKDPIFFAGGDTDLFGYVQNDPVNFVDPTGQFLVSGTVLVGYVYGPAIVAAGTAAAYRLGPYLPAILDYAEGFLPGPPSTALGVGGALTKEILENTWDSISDALENNDKPCP